MSSSDLVLVEQDLCAIPEVHFSSAASVKTLNLTGNTIRPPGGLERFTAVEALILDQNELDSLEGFPVMPTVTTLWLNKNRFADLPSLIDQIRASFPSVQVLSLLGNPCAAPLVLTSEEDVMRMERYRRYLSYRLSPNLAVLDSSRITDKERAEGKAGGELLVPRKPKSSASATAAASSSSSLPSASTAVSSAAAPSAESPTDTAGSAGPKKGGNAFLALGRPDRGYDGSHSEGNRFILDSSL